MGNYVNGYQYPQVIIQRIDDKFAVETIDFDLCGEGGLVESYEEDHKRNQLEVSARYVDFDYKGTRIKFTLDYSNYVKKNNLFNIEKIYHYNARSDEYIMKLRPRADVIARVFEVRLEPGYEIGIMKGGVNTKGHRLTVINFITTEPVSKGFLDPDTLAMPLFKFFKA